MKKILVLTALSVLGIMSGFHFLINVGNYGLILRGLLPLVYALSLYTLWLAVKTEPWTTWYLQSYLGITLIKIPILVERDNPQEFWEFSRTSYELSLVCMPGYILLHDLAALLLVVGVATLGHHLDLRRSR